MENTCFDCGESVDKTGGEMFTPYQVPDLPDNKPILVCTGCSKLPKHQARVEDTDINLRAEESHQEYWAKEQNNSEEL